MCSVVNEWPPICFEVSLPHGRLVVRAWNVSRKSKSSTLQRWKRCYIQKTRGKLAHFFLPWPIMSHNRNLFLSLTHTLRQQTTFSTKPKITSSARIPVGGKTGDRLKLERSFILVVRFKGPEMKVDRSCHVRPHDCISEPETICLEAFKLWGNLTGRKWPLLLILI